MAKKANAAKPAAKKKPAAASKPAKAAPAGKRTAAQNGEGMRLFHLWTEKALEKEQAKRQLGPAKARVKELNALIDRLDNEMIDYSEKLQQLEKGQGVLFEFVPSAPAMTAAAQVAAANKGEIPGADTPQKFVDGGVTIEVSANKEKFVVDKFSIELDVDGTKLEATGRTPKKFSSVEEARIGALEAALTKLSKDAGKPAVDAAIKDIEAARHKIPGSPDEDFLTAK